MNNNNNEQQQYYACAGSTALLTFNLDVNSRHEKMDEMMTAVVETWGGPHRLLVALSMVVLNVARRCSQ